MMTHFEMTKIKENQNSNRYCRSLANVFWSYINIFSNFSSTKFLLEVLCNAQVKYDKLFISFIHEDDDATFQLR